MIADPYGGYTGSSGIGPGGIASEGSTIPAGARTI